MIRTLVSMVPTILGAWQILDQCRLEIPEPRQPEEAPSEFTVSIVRDSVGLWHAQAWCDHGTVYAPGTTPWGAIAGAVGAFA